MPELKEIRCTEAEWHIGAAATLTQIEEKMASEFPALADMLRVFGSRQVRNRATMGGNIVTASPIGDSAPVLLALDAKVVLVSQKSRTGVPPVPGNGETGETPVLLSERTLPIDEFFVAYRKTALQPGEILKTIIVPRWLRRALRASARGSRFPNGARWTSAPWPPASRWIWTRTVSCGTRGSPTAAWPRCPAGAQDRAGAARQALVRGDG